MPLTVPGEVPADVTVTVAAARDLRAVFHHLALWQHAIVQALALAFAFEQLGNQILQAVLAADIENRQQVRMDSAYPVGELPARIAAGGRHFAPVRRAAP